MNRDQLLIDLLVEKVKQLSEERAGCYADLIGQEHRLGTKAEILESKLVKLEEQLGLSNLELAKHQKFREAVEKHLKFYGYEKPAYFVNYYIEAFNTHPTTMYDLQDETNDRFDVVREFSSDGGVTWSTTVGPDWDRYRDRHLTTGQYTVTYRSEDA